MTEKNITSETLKSLMDAQEVVLIDVREPKEYQHAHIPGALNIPMSSLKPDSLAALGERKIVLQCNSGNRSMQTLRTLKGGGCKSDLINLEGGIQGWRGCKFETSAATSLLPIDRQTQLAIGLMVLAGTALGYALHPAFLLLPAMMGAGLTNAGLTGWCGLAKLLAVMPWNR